MLMPDFNAIRNYYRSRMPEILQAGRSEWGLDPYEWDTGLIRMTPIENWFWHDIRRCDAVLYPQFPVSKFFVDFANPCAKVAIECDGFAFHQDKEKDARRDAKLREMGWITYRISGSTCREDTKHGFDEETGIETNKLSRSYQFIKNICDEHNISRSPSSYGRLISPAEMMDKVKVMFGH